MEGCLIGLTSPCSRLRAVSHSKSTHKTAFGSGV